MHNVLEWTDELSVGNKKIDEQHKDIIRTVNVLFDSMVTSVGSKKTLKCIHDLDNYIKNHFSYEEDYLHKYNYPKAKEHIKGQVIFLKEYKKLREKCPDEKSLNDPDTLIDITLGLNNFLVPWVRDHIIKEITEFSAFWKEVAIKEKKAHK
ncbi:hemerythrin family protein [Patescibacteria group bacterium]|nr:hemerythrin family protein [Patescibacteria group bacterium]MBU1722214.1 hemerythrin family protein [Patescibacteria group bacterium]MBU1901165.1 hemerythrin family protein [Patescibacteria group bacterium]